jgi:hypothetical protein
MADVTAIIQQVWFFILNIGSLGFLGIAGPSVVLAFTRILIWVFIFAVLYALSSSLLSGFLKRPQAIIISGIMATISAIFLPDAVLAATGAGWATAVGLFLIGAPIVSLALILYYLPKEPCFWNFVKALLALLILWIVNAMEFHLKSFGKYTVSGGLQQFLDWSWWIALIVSIYYLLRMLSCWMSRMDQGDPSNFWRFINNALQPFRRDDDDTPPRDSDTVDFSPSSPPDGGPSPPPSPDFKPTDFHPGLPDEKKPGPHIPPYDPKKPRPPKDKRIFVDLSPWFLDTYSQGGTSACAAFSAASIVEYIINRINSRKWKYLSTLFLWFNARTNQRTNSGCYLYDVSSSLLNQGDCTDDLWSFESINTNKYLTAPPNVCYEDGLKKRISGVRRLSCTDPAEWIQALIEENPIYFGCGTPASFVTWNHKVYDVPLVNVGGGHAMVIVGYDSHYEHRGRKFEAFKIRNSWGQKWGHNGYVWMPRTTLEQLLRHQQYDPPLVLTGWQKHLPKTKCQIVGRAIMEGHNDGELGETGKKIYDHYRQGVSHKFKVGAIAQINGGLRTLQEITVNDPQGRFILKFEEEVSRFEHLTELPKEFPQLKGIDFKKLPRGVIVYKKSLAEDDKYVYFHIVDFKHSKRGRGGEGKAHPENLCSATIRRGINFSGVPIEFSNEHSDERNVIIPVYPVYTTIDDVDGVIKKLSDAAKKEKEWVDSAKELTEELKKHISLKEDEDEGILGEIKTVDANLQNTKEYLSRFGILERKIKLFLDRRTHTLKEIISHLPEDKVAHYFEILDLLIRIGDQLLRKVTGNKESAKSLLAEIGLCHSRIKKADSIKGQKQLLKIQKLILVLERTVDAFNDDLNLFSTELDSLIIS